MRGSLVSQAELRRERVDRVLVAELIHPGLGAEARNASALVHALHVDAERVVLPEADVPVTEAHLAASTVPVHGAGARQTPGPHGLGRQPVALEEQPVDASGDLQLAALEVGRERPVDARGHRARGGAHADPLPQELDEGAAAASPRGPPPPGRAALAPSGRRTAPRLRRRAGRPAPAPATTPRPDTSTCASQAPRSSGCPSWLDTSSIRRSCTSSEGAVPRSRKRAFPSRSGRLRLEAFREGIQALEVGARSQDDGLHLDQAGLEPSSEQRAPPGADPHPLHLQHHGRAWLGRDAHRPEAEPEAPVHVAVASQLDATEARGQRRLDPIPQPRAHRVGVQDRVQHRDDGEQREGDHRRALEPPSAPRAPSRTGRTRHGCARPR
jgi:hypothetical protein